MLRTLKLLIWAYVVLLIGEGALRKWVFPGLAEPLLVVRDPILLVIYAIAIGKGVFPTNGFIAAIAALTVASVAVSVLGGMTHPLVLAYGLRINYLHLPLIWIMASVLTKEDVHRLGLFFVLVAIPMTALMVQQFRSPMDAWINKGIGLSEGGQIFGAEGKIRPPGVFAFITGPQIFYPFCAAFFFHLASGPARLKWPLLVASGVAILVALPVSISRTVMLATGIVGLTFAASLPFQRANVARVVKPLFLLALVAAVVTQLSVFSEGTSVFQSRWTTAAQGSGGDPWADVLGRMVSTFLNPFSFALSADLIGHGIGVGSNVGSRLLTGSVGFMIGEEEYQKIFGELGWFVGGAFVLFRIVLTFHLGIQAWTALRNHHNALPLLLLSASATIILFGQWAPPTVLGFTVVGCGLILASARTTLDAPPDARVPTQREAPTVRAASLVRSNAPLPSDRRLPATLRSKANAPATPVPETRPEQ